MIKYELFKNGGTIRDMLLGIDSNDIDYSVVIENKDDFATANDAFVAFEHDIKEKGYQVFLSSPEVFTIRSKFPNSKEVADFVIARKEQGYKDNTRLPELIELGTLHDDLLRRDFTVNAMAMDSHGEIIDPFGGKKDIQKKVLRTPSCAFTSIEDDPLRILRAFRFSVTKGFSISDDLMQAIGASCPDRFNQVVSANRVQQEMEKMFKFDTKQAMTAMFELNIANKGIYDSIFDKSGIWLLPTMKKK